MQKPRRNALPKSYDNVHIAYKAEFISVIHQDSRPARGRREDSRLFLPEAVKRNNLAPPGGQVFKMLVASGEPYSRLQFVLPARHITTDKGSRNLGCYAFDLKPHLLKFLI